MVKQEGRLVILILDRGYVQITSVIPHPERAYWYKILAGRTIRRWGTLDGISELLDGPTNSTQLNKVFSGSVPFRAIIEELDVTEKGVKIWKTHLNLA